LVSDKILEYFVEEVERTGVGTGITLYMRGLVVAGITMRSKKYYDLMSTLRSEQFQTTDANEIAIGKSTQEEYKRFFQDQREKATNSEPEYIHLEKATVYSPGMPPTYVAVNPWRGKISSIDAFSIGTNPRV
jgi:hypothetical protein